MKSSVFDFVLLLYYKHHKINLNHSGSYLDSLDWMTKEKILKEIGKILKEKQKLNLLCINKTFHQKKIIGKKLKNNVTISINILYAKKEKIHLVYVSKHNSNPEQKLLF